MYLRSIELTSFRNYTRLGFSPALGMCVLIGDNGQGKSNLLESIHMLATGRSLRAGSERELLRHGQPPGADFARIDARVATARGEVHVEILVRGPSPPELGVSRSVSKLIRLNGLPVRAGDLVGTVNVVAFGPEDLELIAGPPEHRRRFLNVLCSQLDRGYLRSLQRYSRILVQRNTLLRRIREGADRVASLEVWNSELIEHGVRLLEARLGAMRVLGPLAEREFRALSGGQLRLAVGYRSSLGAGPPLGDGSMADLFARRIEASIDRELDQGSTIVGPHRDDLTFELDGQPLGVYGSRGQQRLGVLALKFAELAHVESSAGEAPIVLLDDVLSELDPRRRSTLLDRAAGVAQAFISATDASGFTAGSLEAASLLRVDRGTLTAWDGEWTAAKA
jgi:DNA replication and repair protein RecF